MQALVPVNSRGISQGAVERQIARSTGNAPIGTPEPVVPGCFLHIWEWFWDLLPFEGGRWRAGDCDLLRLKALVQMQSGTAPRESEIGLLADAILEFQQIGRGEKRADGFD